jgi:hypothetical protein
VTEEEDEIRKGKDDATQDNEGKKEMVLSFRSSCYVFLYLRNYMVTSSTLDRFPCTFCNQPGVLKKNIN